MTNFPRANFVRRLAAMVYDVLVAVAVGMVAALLMILVLMILFQNNWIDRQGFEHMNELIQASGLYTYLIQGWVVFWVCLFFMWFWKNGGQTIGMRAWRLKIQSTTDQPMTYPRIFLRMLVSLLGLGNILVLFDVKHRLSLQDRICKTEVITLTKKANHHKSWKTLDS